MFLFLLVLLAAVFAICAIQARRLLTSAIWLAGVSALVSLALYLLGAHQVAVIELSVGAGLVTVLFVFAISISGDEHVESKPVIPWFLVIGMSALVVVLLGLYILPVPITETVRRGGEVSLSRMLWQERGLDVLVQVVLIFAGVLGLLGLLAEVKPPLEGSAAEEIAQQRKQELKAMEGQFSDEGEDTR